MADYLDVSSSGYYEWLKRKESDRKKEDGVLKEVIRSEFKNSKETYGVARIIRELKNHGLKKTEKIMYEVEEQNDN
jgi:hypothetical protein